MIYSKKWRRLCDWRREPSSPVDGWNWKYEKELVIFSFHDNHIRQIDAELRTESRVWNDIDQTWKSISVSKLRILLTGWPAEEWRYSCLALRGQCKWLGCLTGWPRASSNSTPWMRACICPIRRPTCRYSLSGCMLNTVLGVILEYPNLLL